MFEKLLTNAATDAWSRVSQGALEATPPRIHDLFTVESINDEWSDLIRRVLPGTHVLSSLEYYRFCRAFYRVELFYKLFRDSEDNPREYFPSFARLPPWENEQICCVHDYLERRFAEGE